MQIWLLLGIFLFFVSSIGLGWLPAKYWFRSRQQQLVASLTFSIPFLTLQGYFLGYAGLRNLSYLLVAASLFLAYKFRIEIFRSVQLTASSLLQSKILALLIFISLGIQLLGIVGSGLSHANGSRIFYRLQSSDGLMHVAFANSMVKDFPPMQPGAAGLEITNYHYWSNLYAAEISRIFHLPVDIVYFQVIPIIIGILLVAHLIMFGRLLKLNRLSMAWMMFFYFWAGNSLIFISKIIKNSWDFTMPAIDHGMIQFYNLPQAFAKLLLLFFSWWWLEYFQKQKKSRLQLILLFSLPAFMLGYKVYFGLYAYAFIGMWLFIECIKNFKHHKLQLTEILHYFTALVISACLAIAIYAPPNRQAGGLFWAPLAWPKILLGQQNLDWNDWWLRLQVYEQAKSIKGLSVLYLAAAGICIIGIGGTKLLGLAPSKKVFKAPIIRQWWFSHIVVSIIFFFIGMNFLQTSGGANTFNFFIVSLYVWGWFSGIAMGELSKIIKKPLYLLIVVFVVAVSIPRPFQEIWLWYKSYTEYEGSFVLEKNEYEALEFLATLPDGVFVSSPDDYQDYYETPYRSFYANKYSYLSGLGILNSHNQPVVDRQEFLVSTFKQTDPNTFIDLLKTRNISYIFLSSKAENSLAFRDSKKLKENTVFQNNEFKIIEINLSDTIE